MRIARRACGALRARVLAWHIIVAVTLCHRLAAGVASRHKHAPQTNAAQRAAACTRAALARLA